MYLHHIVYDIVIIDKDHYTVWELMPLLCL